MTSSTDKIDLMAKKSIDYIHFFFDFDWPNRSHIPDFTFSSTYMITDLQSNEEFELKSLYDFIGQLKPGRLRTKNFNINKRNAITILYSDSCNIKLRNDTFYYYFKIPPNDKFEHLVDKALSK